MAVRTPLFWDGTDIKQMSEAQINQIKRKVKYLYAQNPSVTLSYVASSGNLNAIQDTRLRAGAYATAINTYPSANPVNTLTISNDKVTETRATVTYTDSDNISYPCYYASDEIVAMSDSDVIDTFIKPALQTFNTSDVTADSFGGLYHVQTTTTYAGSTLVNANPIFADTIANAAAFNDGGVIPETQDQPLTAQNYYLFVKNDSDAVSYELPLHIYTAEGDLYTPDSDIFNTKLEELTRWAAVYADSAKISYQMVNDSDTVYTKRGSGITNTILNSSTSRIYFASSDDYRRQTVPNGTPITANTYYLGITIT